MTEVFLDTGYVVALSKKKDRYHRRARELAEQVSHDRVQVITTQDVLDEIGNALAAVERRTYLSVNRRIIIGLMICAEC